MNLESWLTRHPYLEPLADFHADIESVLSRVSDANIALPDWAAYSHDFHAGIPLLRSSHVNLDLRPAEKILAALLVHLVPASGKVAENCRVLQEELSQKPDAPESAIGSLLDRVAFESSCPGLLRFLGWAALSRHLHPTLIAFNHWRDDDRWLRSYCPACGGKAAMAQLLSAEQGRRRLLCCGLCSTRWLFRRTGCPFCEVEDDHSLGVLAVEGEGGLRIDYCQRCRGYLKTYNGEGKESLLLANWTSLHLDVLARDEQLNPFAEPVYQF